MGGAVVLWLALGGALIVGIGIGFVLGVLGTRELVRQAQEREGRALELARRANGPLSVSQSMGIEPGAQFYWDCSSEGEV